MSKLRPTVVILGACLLQACVAPPTNQEMSIQPLLRVRHSSDQSAVTYYQLGKYHQKRGNLDLALKAYTQSISLDRRQLEARNALAAIYSRLGRLEEAKALLLQLVADFPAVAHPYNNLGYVYYLQGDYAASVTTLRRALALDSGNEWARNNLNAVQTALASQGERAAVDRELAPSVPATRPQGASLTVSSLVPQTRMEVVQIAPNVYELKPKTDLAPGIAERPVEKAALAAAATVPVAVTAAKTFKVEIANGNGITGMARRMKHLLGQRGIAVSRLSNQRPFTHLNTEIRYRIGYKQEAEALQMALRGYAVVVSDNDFSGSSDVRLVLGKDAVAHMAKIDGSAIDSPLALNVATTQTDHIIDFALNSRQ